MDFHSSGNGYPILSSRESNIMIESRPPGARRSIMVWNRIFQHIQFPSNFDPDRLEHSRFAGWPPSSPAAPGIDARIDLRQLACRLDLFFLSCLYDVFCNILRKPILTVVPDDPVHAVIRIPIIKITFLNFSFIMILYLILFIF